MDLRTNKTVIILAGPTASGKTGVAIELARHFGTEIVSADSRQCFRELNIGVARPSEEQLTSITHHFIASHSIHDNVNAGTFEQYALEKVNDIFQRYDVVIMAGGSGLYIRTFCDGLDEIPGIPERIRQSIISNYEEKGLQWLQNAVREKDELFYHVGEIQNPQRMMRALEVAEATGKSILDFRKDGRENRTFDIIKIGLQLPREELHRNINARVDKMIDAGLVEETKDLFHHKHLNALRTVGYSEIFDYLDGQISLHEAVERIKTNTRNYAKRQITWFRKDKEIKWFSPTEIEKMKGHLHDALH
jgi:tRNA dimethylallyltransferase